MAQLVQSFAGDTAIRLQNEEFVRKMPWGWNWKALRISLHYSLPGLGGSAGFTPNLYIGVCKGSTNTFKSASCEEWVGGSMRSVTTVYGAGPPVHIWSANANPHAGYKIGASYTDSAAGMSAWYIPKTIRYYSYTDIIVTATGYTVITAFPFSLMANVDITQENFRQLSMGNDAANPATVNYTSQYQCDHVSIYWDYASIGLEISEIEVIRTA